METYSVIQGQTVLVLLFAFLLTVISSYAYISWTVKHQILVGLSRSAVSLKNDHSSEETLSLSAVNASNEDVTLVTGGLRLPDKSELPLLPGRDLQFPQELGASQRCSGCIEAFVLTRAMHYRDFRGEVELIGYFRDQRGITYQSPPLRYAVHFRSQGVGEPTTTKIRQSASARQRKEIYESGFLFSAHAADPQHSRPNPNER